MSDAALETLETKVMCFPAIRKSLTSYALQQDTRVAVAAHWAILALRFVLTRIGQGDKIGFFPIPRSSYDVVRFCGVRTKRRLALIDIDALALNLGGQPVTPLPLEIQTDHDTWDWFLKYAQSQGVAEEIALALGTTLLVLTRDRLLGYRAADREVGTFALADLATV